MLRNINHTLVQILMRTRQNLLHMKRTIGYFVRMLTLLSFTLSLSACFDIVEDVTVHNNGTGFIKATMNMSKSKTKIASLMQLDKVDGMKVPKQADVRREMNNVISILQKTPGISNVQHSLDFNNFVGTLSCEFSSVAALNAFTSALSKRLEVNISGYSNYTFNSGSGVFERRFKPSPEARKKLESLSPESKKSFDNAYYSAIYRFDKPIRSVSNAQAKISSNKKAVMLKVPALQVVEGQINLSNNIQLSN